MMADEVVVKFVPDVKDNEYVKSIQKNVDTIAKNSSSFLGRTLANTKKFFSSTIVKMVAVLGTVGMIYSSSKMLQGVIKGLWNVAKSIIRVISDMVAMVLLPLVYVLTPFSKMLRLFMLPYKKQMLEAVKTGNQYYMLWIKSGKKASEYLNKAVESWALAVGFAFKPFFDMLMYGFQYLFGSVINILISVLDYLIGWIPGVHDRLMAFREGVLSGLDNTFNWIRNITNESMVKTLDGLKGSLDNINNQFQTTKNSVEKALNDTTPFLIASKNIETASFRVAKATYRINMNIEKLNSWAPSTRINRKTHEPNWTEIGLGIATLPFGGGALLVKEGLDWIWSRITGADNSGS